MTVDNRTAHLGLLKPNPLNNPRLVDVVRIADSFELIDEAVGDFAAELDAMKETLEGQPLVLLVSGQSNTTCIQRTLDDSAPSIYDPAGNLRVWNNPNFEAPEDGIDTSTARTGTAFIDPPANRLMLATAWADGVARANPRRPVYLITAGYGGMSITHWLPGTVAPDLHGMIVANVSAALAAIGVDRVDAYGWWQGESDRTDAGYTRKFEAMLERLYANSWFPRNTQILIFGLAPSEIVGSPLNDDFNSVLRGIAGIDPQFRRYIDTSFLPAKHWDPYQHGRFGYDQIGRAAADAFAGKGGELANVTATRYKRVFTSPADGGPQFVVESVDGSIASWAVSGDAGGRAVMYAKAVLPDCDGVIAPKGAGNLLFVNANGDLVRFMSNTSGKFASLPIEMTPGANANAPANINVDGGWQLRILRSVILQLLGSADDTCIVIDNFAAKRVRISSNVGDGQVQLRGLTQVCYIDTAAPLANGGTFAVPADAGVVSIFPGAGIASGTLALPATPVNGQVIHFISSAAVTALTITSLGGHAILGAPATIDPATPFALKYFGGVGWQKFV